MLNICFGNGWIGCGYDGVLSASLNTYKVFKTLQETESGFRK
jgi:hypothetical protein